MFFLLFKSLLKKSLQAVNVPLSGMKPCWDFNMESSKNMVLGNGLTFEGKYALAKYSPDDDNLDLEIQK